MYDCFRHGFHTLSVGKALIRRGTLGQNIMKYRNIGGP